MNMQLYNNIVLTKGHKRSLLIDLQTGQYLFVNNTNDIVQDNQELLQEKQMTAPELFNTWRTNFPSISIKNHQQHFYNGIIDIGKQASELIELISDFLHFLNCNSIQIRFLANIKEDSINMVIKALSKLYMLENIEIVISEHLLSSNLINYVSSIPFHSIILYDVQNETNYPQYTVFSHNPFHASKIFFSFYFNKQFFVEANSVNPYFFNKIYIDEFGYVYNSPETLDEKICHIETDTFTNIKSVINLYLNQSHNIVSKNKICICKDCELRYSCMDNRKVKHNNSIYWHNIRCTYNPYIGKWVNQTGYHSIDECGVFSSELGFIANEKEIFKLNQKDKNI
jgi:hypothetical protein